MAVEICSSKPAAPCAAGRRAAVRRFLVVEAAELGGVALFLAGDGRGGATSSGRVFLGFRATPSGGVAASTATASDVRGCAPLSLTAWVARWRCVALVAWWLL
jgi:hypothetical protein